MANLQITFDEMLMEFEMFWDSEVPRFGEQVSYHISYHNRMGCQCTALISFFVQGATGWQEFYRAKSSK
jgi:hypothetical protein